MFLFVGGDLLAQTTSSVPTSTLDIGTAMSASPEIFYEVKPGDTLWKFKQAQWRELLQYNPWLLKEGRYEKVNEDLIIVKVIPGETITMTPALVNFLEDPPVEQEPPLPPPVKIKTNEIQPAPQETSGPPIGHLPWLILVGLIFLGMYLLAKKYFTITPAVAGPPVVAGGIAASETNRVEARFEEMVRTQHPGRRLVRVGPTEEGFLSGWGIVGYANGFRRFARFNREPAFRARFREEGSTREEELFFLQACANDVTFYGRRYTRFRFEPRQQPEAAPIAPVTVAASEPPPPVVAPVPVVPPPLPVVASVEPSVNVPPPDPPTPAPAPAAIMQMPLREVENREAPPVIISLGHGSMSVPAGSHVRFENGQIVIEKMGDGRTILMASPKKKKKPRQITRRSGTTG